MPAIAMMSRWTSFVPDLSQSRKWFKSKPKLKIHEPTTDPYRMLDAEADELLAKVKRDGVDSLTDTERRQLEDFVCPVAVALAEPAGVAGLHDQDIVGPVDVLAIDALA